MSLSFNEARDQILKVFADAWGTTGYPARYSDAADSVPTTKTIWARATLQHADGGQASLSGPINGCVRHERIGTVFVQIFAPVGDGLTAAYDAAQIVANAFEHARNLNAWFRRVRINEVGTNGGFEQINVLADFTYDDVR